MAHTNITLPVQNQTTSAGALASPVWDVSDAVALSVSCDAATTAPGPVLFAAYTTESTAAFFKVVYQSSGASVTIITSSESAFIIAPVPFKQLRGHSTGAPTAAPVFRGVKTIDV